MDDLFRQSMQDVKLAFDLFKESISLFRMAKDALPDSDKKVAITQAIEEAEKKAKISEGGLAQSLGFLLCPKCWPPSVLTATMVSRNLDKYECPSCKTEYLNHSKRNGRVRLQEATSNIEISNQ